MFHKVKWWYLVVSKENKYGAWFKHKNLANFTNHVTFVIDPPRKLPDSDNCMTFYEKINSEIM